VSQISQEVRDRIREQASNQCGYCRSLQKYVLGVLEIDYLVPRTIGGTDNEDNLWLACRLCNSYKGIQIHGQNPKTDRKVKLFNPRQQKWSRHFEWTEQGMKINGITTCGRATVFALQLNNSNAIVVRESWISAGWHPPQI
jgi:5-methylcytosine-specific restriction endonuclease McrA